MLLYHPVFRHPDQMTKPANLAEAEATAPGITPVYPAPADFAVDVETPSGTVLAVDDPLLVGMLQEGIGEEQSLTLHRSDRAMTDCRPVAVFSMQTLRQIGKETGVSLDKRRFRANIYADLDSAGGFAEDGFLGHRLRIGDKAMIAVVDRDPRCKMVILDPDTAEANPAILRGINQAHQNKAGVYGAVLVEGTIRPGDEIVLEN